MLKHIALPQYIGWPDIFKNTSTVAEFDKKLRKAANDYQKEDPGVYDFLKMVGDGAEIFVECLFRLTESNKRFGIKNYTPVLEDTGTDGIGIFYTEKPAVVQVKWRFDPRHDTYLTATGSNLDSFWGDGQYQLQKLGHPLVIGEKPRRMILVTNATGLHHYTENIKFKNEIKDINYKYLSDELDGQMHFWNDAYELVKCSMP